MSKKATEVLLTLDEMARSKFKIAVDANLYGIGDLLQKKRYNVLSAPPRIPDTPKDGKPNVHDFLVKENVKIFITRNKDHFNGYFNKHYALIELALGGLDEPAIAGVLEKVMMYEPDLKPMEEYRKSAGKKKTRYRKVIIDGTYMATRYNEIVP